MNHASNNLIYELRLFPLYRLYGTVIYKTQDFLRLDAIWAEILHKQDFLNERFFLSKLKVWIKDKK